MKKTKEESYNNVKMMDVIKILDYACKPHLLYLVIFEGNDELFCKVGITGNDVESRFKDESNYEILKYTTIKFKNGKEARGIESILLEQILSIDDKYKPLKQFGGYSECYNANIYGKISKIFKVIPTHKLNIENDPFIHNSKIENKYFNFGLNFEKNLISIILTDHTFGSGILDVLDINYFGYEDNRKIIKTIKDEYEKHGVIPDMNNLEIYFTNSVNNDLERDFILMTLKHIKGGKGYDKCLVKEVALRFCKEQNKTFMESKKDKESNSQIRVNKLLDVAKARQRVIEQEADVFSDIDEILKLPTQRMEGNTEKWELDGKLHREDGPALIYSNGTEHWYFHGKLHREDGPAIIKCTGTKEWYLHGKLHREDGPAKTMGNGSRDEWYLHGEFQREKRYTQKIIEI